MDLEAQLALVRWHGVVHRVREQQVWLTGLDPQLKNFLPDLAGIHRAEHFT